MRIGNPDKSEFEVVHSIRISPRAHYDIEEASDRFARIAGLQIADEWEEGLERAITSLATFPQREPIAPESRNFSFEVRHLIYRRRADSVAYRILFSVLTEPQDAPTVFILHVRHGAAQPSTRRAARDIESEEI